MSKVKICGLSRVNDILAVNIAKPDFVGFVFAKSKRQITLEMAVNLKAYLTKSIKTVGVFVNESIETIELHYLSGVIDMVQLHGDEDNSYISTLKSTVPLDIIKAVRVQTASDIVQANNYKSDYLLLDAYNNDCYGGSGTTFDWSLIRDINKPFFLAGGINIDNICHAITAVKPFCVDVSSGVETDGQKDQSKIMNLVRSVRLNG